MFVDSIVRDMHKKVGEIGQPNKCSNAGASLEFLF